jgi:hypothetical protein
MDLQFHGSLHNGINIMQAIEGHIKTLKNTNLPKQYRAFALSWLLHLIGDSHQPLHCTSLFSENYFTQGDRGGNDILIQGQGRISNLHWYWDSRLNNSTSFKFINRRAEVIFENNKISAQIIGKQTPQQSLADCKAIAIKYAYTPILLETLKSAERNSKPQPKIFISESYDQQARKIAEQQTTKAAFKLFNLLNSIH